MKGYFSKTSFGIGMCVAGLFVALTCCTKVDNQVGLGLVPSDQVMGVHVKTLEGNINTFVTITDSMPSSGLNKAYIGRTGSTTFGTTTASALMQYSYIARTDTTDYGVNITPDSMWIITSLSYIAGDSMRTQSYYVYKATETIYSDSTYYNGQNYSAFYDPTPMFKFSLRTPTTGVKDTLRFEIVNQAAAASFLKELAEVDTLLYETDSLFRAKFKGFYIAPAPTSTKKGAIYSMTLGYDEDYTDLYLFAHSYDPKAPTEVYDTIVRAYTFSDDKTYKMSNTTANSIEHDYTGTQISPVADYLTDLGAPVSRGYVQGMVGATTTLEFTDQFWKELKALASDKQSLYINKASLYLPVETISADNYDAAPTRVGSYLKYSTLSNIADYYYLYEQSASSSSSTYALNYDGYLNRSNGWYRVDIASYLQRVLLGKTKEKRFTLGQEAYSIYKSGEIVLKGSVEQPLKISITYTLIDN